MPPEEDKNERYDEKQKRLHNVKASSDEESSGYEDKFDLNPVTIDAVRSRNAQELFAQVVFNTSKDGTKAFTAKGKVDTGAMVSCMPASMLPKIGLSSNDLTPNGSVIRGMSGADLQNVQQHHNESEILRD